MPNTLPTKYDKTSPEETMRSLHIRLDQPSSDYKPLNRLNKTKGNIYLFYVINVLKWCIIVNFF